MSYVPFGSRNIRKNKTQKLFVPANDLKRSTMNALFELTFGEQHLVWEAELRELVKQELVVL
jgi:hypothetical protein